VKENIGPMFAGPIYMPAPKYTVTISRSLQSDDKRMQPKRSRSSQRTHKDFLQGQLTHCLSLNPVTIP
jgi:hypothetical protein